jgi:transglutaminase-like putative cysteine protease
LEVITPTSHLNELPPGVNGVRATLKRMVAIVRRYKTDETTIGAARSILKAAATERDTGRMIAALQGWVRDKIMYVADPADLEMIQTPPRTLTIRTGDCDDKAILLATFLESVGLKTRFEAIGVNGGPYSHVLLSVRYGKGWLPLETIVPGAPPGWFPPDATCLMVAHV